MDTVRSWNRGVKHAIKDARRQVIQPALRHSLRLTTSRAPDFELPKGSILRGYEKAKRFGAAAFLSILRYPLLLLLMAVAAVVLIALALGGSSSTAAGIINLYIVNLRYVAGHCLSGGTNQASTGPGEASSLEVRIGYFGVCARTSSQAWDCGNSAATLDLMRASLASQDPAKLLGLAYRFKDEVLFPWFL